MVVQISNLYVLAVTRTNVNAMSVVCFLHRLVGVFKHYFQELEEESLRDNFVIVYELLDEVMDFGYPQVSVSTCTACPHADVTHHANPSERGPLLAHATTVYGGQDPERVSAHHCPPACRN